MDEYMGTIVMWPLNWAPVNWMFCNGQILPVQSNAALFALLGTTYGGNGTTTFALPDLRGRVPAGYDMGSAPPAAPNLTLGEVGGEANHTLLQTEMPTHTHVATLAGGGGSVKVGSGNATQSAVTAGASIATPGSVNGRSFAGTLGFNTSAPDTALNAASLSLTGTVTNATTGGNLPHNNMQPYIGLSFIICTSGLFPSRP